MSRVIKYWLSNLKRSVVLVPCVLFVLSPNAQAQHLRIFACAIANDSAGAFMGASSKGSGLYQSDDTGETWKHLGWDNIKCYSMDMVQSSNGRILYMATGLGVLRSTDYGEHWKQITDWRISEVMDVAVNQMNPNEIWIASAHGAWTSNNEGKTWSEEKSLRMFLQEITSIDSFSRPHWCGLMKSGVDITDLGGCRHSGIYLFTESSDIPDFALSASLSNGVENLYTHKKALLYHSIWTLKSFLVTP